MNFNKELFKQVLNDKFFREFFDSRENGIRYSTSVISAVCSELRNHINEKEDCQLIDKILNHCNQILKLTEVYRNLSEALDEQPIEKNFIEINDFLSEFCKQSNAAINEMFRIEYITSEAYTIYTAEKTLTFAMLICVRRAILSGVSKIEIRFANSNDECVIKMKFAEFRNENLDVPIFENITSDYADDIILTVISELGGKYRSDEHSAEFILPAENDSMSMLSAPERRTEKHLFNPYNNILSDLFDI